MLAAVLHSRRLLACWEPSLKRRVQFEGIEHEALMGSSKITMVPAPTAISI